MFCLSVNGLSGRIGFSILLCASGSIGQAVELPPEPVIVFPSEINLLTNGRQRVVVQQHLANDLPVDLTRQALFTSSDPAVAVVEQGVVRALGEGY